MEVRVKADEEKTAKFMKHISFEEYETKWEGDNRKDEIRGKRRMSK